ncbi:MAG TPA: HAD-IIIC family phosphatase [Candidatus Angelobacter sp.]|nr:HAD-IIIC family phosphatase [Candidatus Angelobacter sp.]
MSSNLVEPLKSAENSGLAVSKRKPVKLLIWDLDNTLWEGTLLEDASVRLHERIRETLAVLDQRGILHSIASKNDHETAMSKLRELGLDEYFLYPQVNWNSKAANIREIVTSINIGMDAVAFIDDQPFEREEVRHSLQDVLVLDASELPGLIEREEFIPPFITDDSARRRHMYRADIERKKAEDVFIGPQEEFLASLKMKFTMTRAQEGDLQRAEELTVRTHQLNTTGYTYSYEELDEFRRSQDHLLFVASLVDKFGDYGKIGLVLVEKGAEVWTVKLLLMSCRVMSRGVGTILMNHILMLARDAGVRLRAEFRSNGKNRMMLITYKFGGFKEVEKAGDLIVFEHDLERIQPHPAWVDLVL